MNPVGTVTAASQWLSTVPKIELHLHLEGAMRSETVREMSHERMGWSGPLGVGWEHSYYTYTDFGGFMTQLTPRFPWQPEEYARIARECFEDLVQQHVVYAEVSFEAPVRIAGEDTRFWPIMDALEEERRRAESDWPVRINYIVGLQRSLPVDVAVARVRLAAAARDRGYGVVGIDLHGDEVIGPPAPFVPAYDLARSLGLGLRAHAGEAAGPESVRDAIDLLRVSRIAHGVRAIEDPVLLDRLCRGDITLEICPTSNVRTGLYPDLAAHPIRRFYDLGVPITINSDDPLPFFTTIDREYRLLVDEFGFTPHDVQAVIQCAARAAFLSDVERCRLNKLISSSQNMDT